MHVRSMFMHAPVPTLRKELRSQRSCGELRYELRLGATCVCLQIIPSIRALFLYCLSHCLFDSLLSMFCPATCLSISSGNLTPYFV
jgi:hypothetical protein